MQRNALKLLYLRIKFVFTSSINEKSQQSSRRHLTPLSVRRKYYNLYPERIDFCFKSKNATAVVTESTFSESRISNYPVCLMIMVLWSYLNVVSVRVEDFMRNLQIHMAGLPSFKCTPSVLWTPTSFWLCCFQTEMVISFRIHWGWIFEGLYYTCHILTFIREVSINNSKSNTSGSNLLL